jgi:hypothetical protein
LEAPHSVRQSRLSIALARKLDAKSQLCRLRRARRLRALVAGGNPQPSFLDKAQHVLGDIPNLLVN